MEVLSARLPRDGPGPTVRRDPHSYPADRPRASPTGRWYPILTDTTPAGPHMADVTREQLYAYLDDALDDAEAARIEKLIRGSARVRARLREVREERGRGEHACGRVRRAGRHGARARDQLRGRLPDV